MMTILPETRNVVVVVTPPVIGKGNRGSATITAGGATAILIRTNHPPVVNIVVADTASTDGGSERTGNVLRLRVAQDRAIRPRELSPLSLCSADVL